MRMRDASSFVILSEAKNLRRLAGTAETLRSAQGDNALFEGLG
jgi:hypothetical protein